jgi:hypothetical protein
MPIRLGGICVLALVVLKIVVRDAGRRDGLGNSMDLQCHLKLGLIDVAPWKYAGDDLYW